MGPNITCQALVLETADPAQNMYIGFLSKQMWALITYIGPGPQVLSSDRPTIYNHASRPTSLDFEQGHTKLGMLFAEVLQLGMLF